MSPIRIASIGADRNARGRARAFKSLVLAAVVTCGLGSVALRAQDMPPAGGGMQMPDPKQMSGMPLPVGDVQPGTVVVRVIRGSLTNVIPNQPVDLVGGPSPLTVKTNDSGRAEFTHLTPGTRVKAVTTVNGEKLESQEFEVPSTGGIRLMLVATDPEAEKKAAEDRKLAQGPAQPGIVVLGDQSRFVFDLSDDGLSVFNIVQILNTARTPVQPPQPIVFDLPDGALGASMLDGSSPQASVAGRQVTVKGPFAPGVTLVQFAYSMPYSGGDVSISQRLPAALTQFTVLAQKAGDMQLSSPQMTQHRDMSAEGQTYIVGQGPAVKAGETVTFNFTGLPHAPVWPRNLALAAAVVILGWGGWAAAAAGRVVRADESRRQKLGARRDRLFAELTTIEQQHRDGAIDEARYTARRQELVAALERVYGELDEEAAA